MLLGERDEILALRDARVQLLGQVLALDENVAGAHFLLRLRAADLLVVEFLRVRFANGFVQLGLEVILAQRAAAPIVHPLLEGCATAELRGFRGIGKELVLDDVLEDDTAARLGRNAAELVADLGLGKLHVRFGDGLAINLGDDLLLRLVLGDALAHEMNRDGEGRCQQRSGENGSHELVHRGDPWLGRNPASAGRYF